MSLHTLNADQTRRSGPGRSGAFELDLRSGRFRVQSGARNAFGPDVIGKDLQTFSALLHPEDRMTMAHALARSEGNGERLEQNCRVLIHGGYRWLKIQGEVESVDGSPVRLSGFLETISANQTA
ncbi:PAS domain-containing protein [Elongatibacter sediminis]|uniref:PAS domain-containing protein n=1 Tax=Elongatibacter sediminis TaxID=3119006 RepID=A0AAW9RJF5_9GAMM